MRRAYEGIFSVIHLIVTFTIDELVIASDDIAYALTRSNGTQTVLATDTQSAESNREVFIFRNEDGAWKIARYMFNKSEITHAVSNSRADKASGQVWPSQWRLGGRRWTTPS